VPHYHDDIKLIVLGITYRLDETLQICKFVHHLLILVKRYYYVNL